MSETQNPAHNDPAGAAMRRQMTTLEQHAEPAKYSPPPPEPKPIVSEATESALAERVAKYKAGAA